MAKNRNGPDGIVFPIFMDTSNVCIKVLEGTAITEVTQVSIQRNKKKILLKNIRNLNRIVEDK